MAKRWTLIAAVLLAGCAAQSPKKWQPNPHSPPAYPRAQNMPIDQSLRDAAEQELTAAERSDDPFIRSHAIEARQDVNDRAAERSILHGLNDSSEVVRFSAAMAAGRLRLAVAKPDLLKLLGDPNQDVRVGAIYALYSLGEKSRAHELEKLAFDVDPQVRANTAMAIGLMGNPTGIRVLRAMATDASPMVRMQVAESRWRLGDMDGLTDLISGTISKYPDEQIVCLLALAGPGDARVAEHVRSKLVSDYPEVSLAAARGMGELGSDEGYGVAMIGEKSPDPRQRALAALAFGAIGRKDAQPYLAELIKDNDANVRIAAATAILQLK